MNFEMVKKLLNWPRECGHESTGLPTRVADRAGNYVKLNYDANFAYEHR